MAFRESADEQIRLMQLSDALSGAQNHAVVRNHVLTATSMGAAVLYWAIPSALSAFAGPDGFSYDLNVSSFDARQLSIGAYGRIVALERAAGLTSWIPQPTVRFVRLDAAVAAELVVSQRARTARFPDGLHMLDGTAMAKKLLVATTFSTPIRVAPPHVREAAMLAPGMPATETPDAVDILLSDVYVKESFVKILRERLRLHQDAGRVLLRHRKGQQVARVKSNITNRGPLSNPTVNDDPYKLKDRAPAVYALYRTAELCSRNPDYQLELSTRGERKEIASAVLEHLAESSPGLRKVFKKVRRGYAATLIDPERDPNEGLSSEDQRTWPTKSAATLLELVDERRQSFVNQTLGLAIYAAQYWLALPTTASGGEKSRVPALDAWLVEHGLTGEQERKTLFPIITFDGVKFVSAPKSAAPSPSRAPASGGRRASRRRV